MGLWRSGVVLASLALCLPLWIEAGRADPLFLLPLLGWTALAFVEGHADSSGTLKQRARRLTAVVLIMVALVWAVSGRLALGQIAILTMLGVPMIALHQWLASDRLIWRRAFLQALLVIVWVPVGMAVADAAYRWPSAAERPRVMLLSSLPLVWGSATGSLASALAGEVAPAPLFALLSEGTDVQPVDSVTAAGLRRTQVLLMVQPRALPANALLAIDDWVRQGGRVLWLADPLLLSGQDFPLGDPRNPNISEANGSLLVRWGMHLRPPANDAAGLPAATDDGLPLLLQTPGQLQQRGGPCRLSANGIIARCQIGQGEVVVLADADMVNADYWTRPDGANAHHPLLWTSANGQWVMATLRALAGVPRNRSLAAPVWVRP